MLEYKTWLRFGLRFASMEQSQRAQLDQTSWSQHRNDTERPLAQKV